MAKQTKNELEATNEKKKSNVFVVFTLLLFLGLLLYPTLSRQIMRHRTTKVMNELKDLHSAIDHYARKHKETYPKVQGSKASSNAVLQEILKESNGLKKETIESFSYTLFLPKDGTHLTDLPANTPLLASPIIRKANISQLSDAIFYSEVYNGQAIILRTDGSVRTHLISETDHLMWYDTKHIPVKLYYPKIAIESSN